MEVLLALAVTAFVAAAAYAGLAAVIDGVEGTRAVARRTEDLNRTLMILSRDLRQFAPRPVRDEFGEPEPALSGGPLAPFALTLTRSGWHPSAGQPRSHLERVSYYLEDEALWRLSWPVLDRASAGEPQRVRLLDGVERLELRFLERLDALTAGRGSDIDSRDWERSWIREVGVDTPLPPPPAAVELRLTIASLGELRRVYALPQL
ncbi:General secretion pathway protein J [Pseudohaliea rubra DSM 19751]|uniref:General secretion pathway protein J n=1 Tax=Pseudohaliea rubra DSM 19751 TaxID=1265313 RepID=A0A095VWD5_9GAMM|nr:General secretion pathway protein J [Pseudohaliea rubra DSM 19751]